MTRLREKRVFLLTVLVACFCAFSVGGCDTFLTKNPEGHLTPDQFYKTKADLRTAVVSAWAPVISTKYGSFGSSTIFVPLMGSDGLTTLPGGNKLTWRAPDRFDAASSNIDLRVRHWKNPYRAIYRVNTLLANLGESPVDDEAFKKIIAAQVRFLRGWLYFWMVRIYGPLPLKLKPAKKVNERAPVEKVYDQIIKDLKFAEEHLPGAWNDLGRPTKWAAKAMLARVYLTMAGWPLEQQGKYDLARDNFLEVMNSGQFHLIEDFGDLWQIETQQNDEIVFALQFCRSCGVFNSLTGKPTVPAEENGWSDVFAEIHFFKDFPKGPRKEATFHTVYADTIHWSESSTGHPFYAKWRSGTQYGGDGPTPVASSRNLPLIRYAHVLLGFAEAQAMADGGPNARAYQAVNKVRDRAGLPDLTPGLGMMAFRDSVLRERAWEFAGEFTRWFDLVRTEKVVEANDHKAENDMKPLRNIQSLPKKHFYWMPLPQQTIELSGLKQNPGY